MSSRRVNVMSLSYRLSVLLGVLLSATLATSQIHSAELPLDFVNTHCYECHNSVDAEGGFDLTALKPELTNREAFGRWVKVHDRVATGEMPPKQSHQPTDAERAKWVKQLQQELVVAEKHRQELEG